MQAAGGRRQLDGDGGIRRRDGGAEEQREREPWSERRADVGTQPQGKPLTARLGQERRGLSPA